MGSVETVRIAHADELGELPAVVAWAFGDTEPSARKWLLGCGLEELRALRDARGIVAGLARVPMAQWFGGKRVPSLGVAGVCVAPEARGQGLALSLMTDALREARRGGLALSALYPASLSLYRALGYELAGYHCRYELRLKDCPRSRESVPLRAATAADTSAIEQVYDERAQQLAGYLARGAYIWNRVRGREEPARATVVEAPDGRIDGYVYISQQRGHESHHDLKLNDFVARSPAAIARLLEYLASHRSTAEKATFYGGPADARLYAFAEHALSVATQKYWMLRIVDVAAALSARGYGARSGEYRLAVDDALLPENRGTYRLIVEDGHARVEASADEPALRLGVGALAALYTGFSSATELASAGLVQGSPRELTRFSDLFAGPAPALADFF